MIKKSRFYNRVQRPVLLKYGDRAKDKSTFLGTFLVFLVRHNILSYHIFRLYKTGLLDVFFPSKATTTSLVLWFFEEKRELTSSCTHDESMDIRWLHNRISRTSNIKLPLPSEHFTAPLFAHDRWYFKQLIRRRPFLINKINFLTNE